VKEKTLVEKLQEIEGEIDDAQSRVDEAAGFLQEALAALERITDSLIDEEAKTKNA
jgi:hypothetical protein